MTTTNFAIPSPHDQAAYLSPDTMASERLVIGGLSLTFLLSFVQYCFERNDVVRLAPVVLLIAVTVLLLLTSIREKRRRLLTAAIRPSLLVILAAVCVPGLFSSLYRPANYPFEYGLALIATLFAVRILLSEIGLEGMLLAFFYGTTVGILIVIGLTSPQLLASVGAKRYAPLFFDPNRISFFAATAIPAQIWFATRQRGKKYVLLVSALCVLVMGAASSRGSIGALAIGAAVAAALYFGRRIKYRSFAISRTTLVGALAVLCVSTIAAAARPSMLDIGPYLSTKLALGDRARGMDSGFTGRTRNWTAVVDALPKTSWVLGNGYRTSEDDFNFSVDSGYLTAVYELGAVATAIVLAKYVVVLYQLIAGYLSVQAESGAGLMALIFTLVVFFSNGFVHRAFFGYGDPASIFALFAFVSTRQDAIEAVHATELEPALFHDAMENA